MKSYSVHRYMPFSVTFNGPVMHISVSRQYSVLTVSLTVQDRHILRPTMDNATHRRNFE